MLALQKIEIVDSVAQSGETIARSPARALSGACALRRRGLAKPLLQQEQSALGEAPKTRGA